MKIKTIISATIVSLCAAQIGFALPAVEDATDGSPSMSTLTASPVTNIPSTEILPAAVQQPQASATSINSDILEKVRALEQTVQELQGRVDELQHELKQSKDEQAQQFLSINKKLAAPPLPVASPVVKTMNNASTTKPTAVAVVPAKVVPAASPATPEAQEKATYDAAYSLVSSKAYADAIEAFNGYLTIYPDGQFAANANYWLGELNASQQNYPSAVKYLEIVVNQYPKSSKVADALLKLGIINKRLGDDAKSQAWLTRLIKEYPKSVSAQSAKEYMN